MEALVINGLTKSFRDKRAVDGVTFSVPKGDIVGFLGPNGAGKTTVMNMVTGLTSPDSGQIDLLGVRNGAKSKEVRARIGYLQEKPRIYPEMTASAYLMLFAQLYAVANPKARVRQVLERVGLTAAAERLIGAFSRGMQQRVCLARVLLHEPEFLVLDEPTLGLDPNGVADMRQIFLRMKAEGMTLLFSSHQLAEMERVCDRVIFMDRGRVVTAGRQDEILPSLGLNDALAVEVFEPLAEHLDAIRVLPEIESVEVSGEFSVNIVLRGSGEPRAMRAMLAHRLRALGLTVLSVGRGNRTLEDVFLALTAQDKGREK
jgi:ABC-2 type transport system ATP-binding protein